MSIKRSGCLLVVSLVCAMPAVAGEGVWTPNGGPGIPAAHVLVDPADPETLYALDALLDPGRLGALWKSTDGGDTWRSIQEGIGTAVDLLALDPFQPELLYAMQSVYNGTSRLWVSEDGGETWAVRFTLPQEPFDIFYQIVASPLHEGTLYAWAASDSVHRSTDGGRTWQKGDWLGDQVHHRAEPLLHHPNRDRLEVVGLEAFWISDDGGRTWQERGSFNGEGFNTGARSAAAPDRLYAVPAASSPCLVRSDDDGAHWVELPSPSLPQNVRCEELAVDPHDSDLVRVIASSTAGDPVVRWISTSRDGGATWSSPRPFPTMKGVATPADPETLFAGTGSPILGNMSSPPGLYKSTDGGQSWAPSWDGIASGDLRRGLVALPGAGREPVLVALSEGDSAFFSQLQAPLVRSVDSGASWHSSAPPEGYDDFQSLVAGGRILYVQRANDRHLLRSLDRGLTWTEVSTPPTEAGPLFADPYLPGRVFMPSHAYFNTLGATSLWRTQDAGTKWLQRDKGLPGLCSLIQGAPYCPRLYALTSDPRDHARVLAAFGGDGFYLVPGAQVQVSTDGGTTWHTAAQSPPRRVTALAPAGPRGAFLAGTDDGGLFSSVDGGEHWTALGAGLPVESTVQQLLRDRRSRAWYAVTATGGIFRSTDDGRTWTDISAGMPDLVSPFVVLDPEKADHLFAAVRGQGLWSWTP
ncbi:MAG TPA: hypothetical protein VMW27_06775 [Thermoanaerobaculia bacterium]|nr:hypothetical protein [Thermoanaerobaculia bacterium]